MKTLKNLCSILILSITLIACSSDDSGGGDDNTSASCMDLSMELSETSQAFIMNQTNATCQAYKEALEAYIAAECEGYEDLQLALEGLPCN